MELMEFKKKILFIKDYFPNVQIKDYNKVLDLLMSISGINDIKVVYKNDKFNFIIEATTNKKVIKVLIEHYFLKHTSIKFCKNIKYSLTGKIKV